jgi:hypothetical protein
MGTTIFFEQTIRDKQDKTKEIKLEFGRSSFYGETLMYFGIDGKLVIVDRETAQKILVAMRDLGAYLDLE